MNFLTIAFCFFICVYGCSAADIMPELKKNILNFGYGVNLKYEGMLSHSFDRFYVVAKFELPNIEDLRLTTIGFDSRCSYLARNDTKKNNYFTKLLKYFSPGALAFSFIYCGIIQNSNLQYYYLHCFQF